MASCAEVRNAAFRMISSKARLCPNSAGWYVGAGRDCWIGMSNHLSTDSKEAINFYGARLT